VTAFFDTNILLYTVSDDPRKLRAKQILSGGGVISVQVLNEFTSAARRKLRHGWPLIELAIMQFRAVFDTILPLTAETHDAALVMARDDGLSFYDALIIASAVEAGCDMLYSEDLQDGRRFPGLVIVNPFAREA
jgi:predicted nucleic acid-binding protein